MKNKFYLVSVFLLTLVACNPQSAFDQGKEILNTGTGAAGDLLEMGKEMKEDVEEFVDDTKKRLDEVQEGMEMMKEGTQKIQDGLTTKEEK